MESRISDVAFCRSVGACNRPRSLILGPIVQNESSNQIDENGHGKSGQTRPFLDAQDEWKLGYVLVLCSSGKTRAQARFDSCKGKPRRRRDAALNNDQQTFQTNVMHGTPSKYRKGRD